ncbi:MULTISPECIES: xanthine dehydrogenase family protein molybdopterin-binding subunit [unclassified Sphingomonas]|uniref:xanthine dehydrogenase family protein molybdopterin-binding subunit n=1 Tax=unclassified Sphingomonas TaxID=196159 RepID=UPI0006F990BB|nr:MULTISPECIES: xanthine dehydrogenase family protein molybdopterin-binding subunit [unclassified Sphingomonas]KQM99487.1 xanthine dehydrogenase [Sphingomonas sp. Leaf226]MDY0966161.1 xanthine dehydrogenase family protein molybdopterin-binding subunit [Sphingomonas sp. CFBP9021]
MFGFGTTNSLTMDKPHPDSLLDSGVQGVIGKPLDRIDGPLKVSGTATYAAEYQFDDMAYGVLVGTKISAGKVVSIDVDAVKSIPGVLDVVTDFDQFIRVSAQGGATDAPTQGVKDIAFFGQIVAIVLAESFEVARDAAARLPIVYDEAEGQYDFAAHRDETRTPPDDAAPAHFKQGDVDTAMAGAAVTVDSTYVTPSQNSAAMEPHASTAVWEEDGSLTLYGAYQMPTSDAQQLAKSLGLSEKKVRIVARYIGGGFGSKLGIAPESVAAAIAAKQLGRPVKAVMSRPQVFEATVRRSNTEQRVRLAANAEGKLTAIGHETLASNQSTEDYFEPAGIGTHLLYGGENRLITHELVDVNLVLSGSMRAPGEAVGMLALEGAMDELAEKLDMDPIELRKRNDPRIDPEKDVPYSSRNLTRALDEGAARFGWDKRQKAGTRREGEWLIGMGVASAVRGNMMMESSAKVEIHPDGTATVSSAMTDIGTGSYTILAQIASEILGIPVENITMSLGDTNDPPAAGSGGSWGAASSGTAVYLACEMLRGKIAKAMGVDEDGLTLKDGKAIGDNRSTPIGELVGKGLEATGHIKPGKQEKETSQAGFGAHFAEVAVNVITGETRVRRMLGSFAAGRVLNAKTARSQCLGGMTFGIGTALTEDLIHDTRTGKLVNHDLGEYHVPANADVPQMDVHFVDERDIHANPIHAKGIGELGISGAGAAVANAVYNATGIRVREFPITLDKLLDQLPAV